MQMRKNLQDIYRLFANDETLMRLLYYLPKNQLDDPLDPQKPNILEMEDKWDIINDRIKPTPKTDDLDQEPKCRLLFYPGVRDNTQNYLIADQEFIVDVLVHFDYENVDFRMSWICDHVNQLLFDNRVTGMSNMDFVGGRPISAPRNYVGYSLIYRFRSSKV